MKRFHLRRYIVRYTVGNNFLQLCLHVAVKNELMTVYHMIHLPKWKLWLQIFHYWIYFLSFRAIYRICIVCDNCWNSPPTSWSCGYTKDIDLTWPILNHFWVTKFRYVILWSLFKVWKKETIRNQFYQIPHLKYHCTIRHCECGCNKIYAH